MLIEEYKSFLKGNGLLPNTIQAYCLDVGQFLRYLTSTKVLVDSVTTHTVVHYFMLSGDSVRRQKRKLSALTSYFGFLVETDHMELNPAASIRRRKLNPTSPRFLKPENVDKVLQACTDIVRRVIISTFYLTGIRLEELRTCLLMDLDLKKRELKITGKGNKVRYVRFPTSLAELFTEYLDYRGGDCPYLFVTDQGEPFSRNQLEYMTQRLSKKTGIFVRPHILRHSFATEAINRGMSRYSVQRLLGHASVTTTEWYIHMEPDVEKDYDKAFN